MAGTEHLEESCKDVGECKEMSCHNLGGTKGCVFEVRNQ